MDDAPRLGNVPFDVIRRQSERFDAPAYETLVVAARVVEA
jgi:hypothetical protein